MPDPDKFEEALVYALSASLIPQLTTDSHTAIFRDIIRDVFPLCTRASRSHNDPDLINAIRQQFKVDGTYYILVMMSLLILHYHC